MRIQRVRIQNYRSIQDLTFEPTDLCALIGGNNTGKSNILKALNLVLGDRWPSVRSLDDRDFYGYDAERDIIITVWFDETREVRGDVGDPEDYTGVRFRVTRYKRAQGKHQKGDLRAEFVCVDADGEPVEVLKRAGRAKPHKAPANVSAAIREDLPAVFIDIDRSAAYHLSGSQWSILGRLLRDISNSFKADTARYEEFRRRFDDARSLLRTPDFDRLHSKVVTHLEQHTGLSGVDIILDDIDPLNLYKSFSVQFKDPETPQPVDADRMGSGIQSAVVISLLQTYRELRKENAVLLFEEPELFLHPHGRRHLFALLMGLADSGTQVLYTTHSQDFVDLTRLDCVCLLSKTADGTQVRRPMATLLTPEWRQRLKIAKYFGSPRNEVFFAESVVLVEGVTEQAAIRLLAEKMPTPLDLDRLDCSVIEVGGKDGIPIMCRAVKALGKRVLAVYDTDSGQTDPTDVATNTRRKADIADALEADDMFLECDPNFETIAGIFVTGSTREKDCRAREHLAAIATWNDVPVRVQELLEAVRTLAEPTS